MVIISAVEGHPLNNEITIFGAGSGSGPREVYADPWLDAYLPRTNVPVSYDIWLHPDFYFDRTALDGLVSIVVDILADTDTLIVHYKVRRD